MKLSLIVKLIFKLKLDKNSYFTENYKSSTTKNKLTCFLMNTSLNLLLFYILHYFFNFNIFSVSI